MRRAFEAAHKGRFGFIDRSKAIVVEAVNVEATGGGGALRRARAQDRASERQGRAQRRASSRMAAGATRRSILRADLPLGAPSTARR